MVRRIPLMSRHSKISQEVAVHLATAMGVVFAGPAKAIALRTADGTIDVTAHGESYLSLGGAADLTVRTADSIRTFHLENANASIKEGRFTVIAETIRELEAESV